MHFSTPLMFFSWVSLLLCAVEKYIVLYFSTPLMSFIQVTLLLCVVKKDIVLLKYFLVCNIRDEQLLLDRFPLAIDFVYSCHHNNVHVSNHPLQFLITFPFTVLFSLQTSSFTWLVASYTFVKLFIFNVRCSDEDVTSLDNLKACSLRQSTSECTGCVVALYSPTAWDYNLWNPMVSNPLPIWLFVENNNGGTCWLKQHVAGVPAINASGWRARDVWLFTGDDVPTKLNKRRLLQFFAGLSAGATPPG